MLTKISLTEIKNLETNKLKMKVFNRWELEKVKINDISISNYIYFNKKYGELVPHSSGNYDKKPFKKTYCPILERLVCSLMLKSRNSGKKIKTIAIVKHAFYLLHKTTGKNPIQLLVDAISNCAPHEDSLMLSNSGQKKREAVDVSPYRKISQAIYFIAVGTKKAAFKNPKSISIALHDEILNAARNSNTSYAIKKKLDLEKNASLFR
ncbi:ribosomal protein S5 (nucleomorph) [Bigelowiella natans]|uniref:Ribosomal protein S5 n=1 Tax=Bigelowiella natans TaxID=227086 RepID=Q3LVW8_BIGNA|nr:ribosomal protein S5 [Bigelowiella natans]ABA27397.1 ribosomal protein S5 [Bigelowiella natans]